MNTVFNFIRSDRIATTLFVVCLGVAVPILLALGSEGWFLGDDWGFLSGRHFTVKGILASHSGHWVSLPFLAFRALYSLFGLHTYVPYQLLAIVSHVSIVGLGYLVMRRMSVQPWLAVVVASALLFFGAGAVNIFTAFQITLNGSIVCGLGLLLLVDHDGPLDYRNVLGVVVAIIGLMTSAAMVPMIIGVFIALLLRKGPVVAVLHVAPPALVFILWLFTYGISRSKVMGTPGQSLEMFTRLIAGPLEALGQNPVVGGVLGVVIVFGLWCACREAVRERSSTALALPAALATAWFSFSIVASVRASGDLSFDLDLPASGRYMYVGAALLLPLIAYGGSHLLRVRWPLALVPVIALALGVPRNVDALLNYHFYKQHREVFLAVAHSALLDQAPGNRSPFLSIYQYTTVYWLRSALANGDIPKPVGVGAANKLLGDRLLALRQDPDADSSCIPQRGSLTVTVQAGDIIKINSWYIRVSLVSGDARSTPALYGGLSGNIVVLAGPVNVEVTGAGKAEPVFCVGRRR